MSPLTVANYRLDGTVMRCAGEILITGCDLPLACRKHRSHIPFLHTAQRMVNPAAQQWLHNRRDFFWQSQSIYFFLGNPQSVSSYLFLVPEPAREQPRSLVIMRKKICSIG